MSNRPLIDPSRVSAEAHAKMEAFHAPVLAEVRDAIAAHDVVVVGMAQNPFVKKVRVALEEAQIPFHYLEYGSYFSKWKERLAIKLWSGWPTFPQVYVKGFFLGGDELTKQAIADGSLRERLGR